MQAKMILTGTRIFYIEDDASNRTIVRTILEAHGATIDFDPWGFPEVSPFKVMLFQPHVILLDLMFPNRVSGYDIYAAIRSRSRLSHIPVVAVSATDAAVEIPRTQATGFQGFINKPLDVRLFPTQIAAILKGETVWYAN